MTDTKNKTPDQQSSSAEQVGTIRRLLGQNKAAALGLAALLATGSVLSGCTTKEKDLTTAGWEVEQNENEDEEENTFYGGGYGGGYYLRTGRPLFTTPGKVSWSKPFGAYTSGGYGTIHGGSAAS